ncbi:MAG: M23 family metallopeptidase [Rhodocyclaceae bacterium]|nr:M23 family metallopeptidase [Rhodocyclaceae bacterium]
MHIIVVSDRLATARTLTLGYRHLAGLAAAFVGLVLVVSSLFSYMTVRHAAEIRLPFLQDLVKSVNAEQAQVSREFLKENLNAMAVKLGQMQAQITRLDSLGERLAALAGVKIQDLRQSDGAQTRDGRGGPLVQASPLSTGDLQNAVESLSRLVESRSDALSILESQLFEERVRKSLLPTSLPIDTQWNASAFGWRIDPFTGERALHEGVDFSAETGTAIKAAAAGVVTLAERHPEYGLVVEIDHGNDLATRYAHASKVHVAPGAVVKRGQKIADVGSSGRSTGPHLHFEVRYRGIAQNPNRFLQQAQQNGAKLAVRH